MDKTVLQNTLLSTDDLFFVPYGDHMIPKYSSWFTDPYLRDMTSTESLDVTEATAAHASWTNDPEKLIFILLDRSAFERTEDDTASMIGDANLIISANAVEKRVDQGVLGYTAEIMLMIGDPAYRGRKLGRQVVLSIMRFGIEMFHITEFWAQISRNNGPSVKLFGNIGYVTESTNEIFNEMSVRYSLTEKLGETLLNDTAQFGYRLETLAPLTVGHATGYDNKLKNFPLNFPKAAKVK